MANKVRAVSQRQRGKIQLNLNCAVGYGVECLITDISQPEFHFVDNNFKNRKIISALYRTSLGR